MKSQPALPNKEIYESFLCGPSKNNIKQDWFIQVLKTNVDSTL